MKHEQRKLSQKDVEYWHAVDVVKSAAKIVGGLVALPVAVGLMAAIAAVVGPVYGGYKLLKLSYRAHERVKDRSCDLKRRRRRRDDTSVAHLIHVKALNNDEFVESDSGRNSTHTTHLWLTFLNYNNLINFSSRFADRQRIWRQTRHDNMYMSLSKPRTKIIFWLTYIISATKIWFELWIWTIKFSCRRKINSF